MFDHKVGSRGFSMILCILQLLVAPFVCLILGLFAGEFWAELLRIFTKNRNVELLFGYAVFACVGFALGYVVRVALPRSYGGQWVWIWPTAVFVWGLLDSVVKKPNEVIAENLGFPLIHEGLSVIVITWPTVATWFYSAGIALANRPATTSAGATIRKAIRWPFRGKMRTA